MDKKKPSMRPSAESCGCIPTNKSAPSSCKCVDCKCASGCCPTGAANFASTEGSMNFASIENPGSSCCSGSPALGAIPTKRFKPSNPLAQHPPKESACQCGTACECTGNCEGGCSCVPNPAAQVRGPAPPFEALACVNGAFKVVKVSDYQGKLP